ncbi:MAG: putative manganese-dependent inorganic diphosphatase [Lachnospiraceae bacterium]|nr:putative manganese-dependent inorganic diphosphatase [Lachnospiraceae bacterium]
MKEKMRPVYIVGHKNPDTDSICSAIAYADIKNRTDEGFFRAMRAGETNEETEFVLRYFDVPRPGYLPDVGTQVRDMQFHETPGVDEHISVKEAWDQMGTAGSRTLPITDANDKLKGIITIGDIANYYMDAQSMTALAEARTQYRAIARTLQGTVAVGNPHGYFVKGKVLVGAALPEQLKEAMDPDDLVILGNREDAQLMAIACGASCLVLCLSDAVSERVRQAADEKDCVVIVTKLDTYTAARLIGQSIPIDHLMTREGIICFHTDDFVDNIKETMGRVRHRDFPVLDRRDRYIGTVSRRNLINVTRKKVILVDHSEMSQAVDNLEQAEILEIVDHHRIGTVETRQPVYFRGEPVGCTATIINRIYHEKHLDIEPTIAGLLCAAILSDTLMFRSPTATVLDEIAARELAQIAGIDLEKFAEAMFKAGSDLSHKTAEEIFYQDFKKFVFGTTVFGVGQISSMSQENLDNIRERIIPMMREECGKNGITMVFYMLTNIMTEDTELLYFGDGAEALIAEAFKITAEGGSCVLPQVVSRKKQLIPAMMDALQNT